MLSLTYPGVIIINIKSSVPLVRQRGFISTCNGLK